MKEIPSLTALRGIFAMWVLVFHLRPWMEALELPAIPLASYGYLAVDFFFLLSGYLLTLVHGDALRPGWTWQSYAHFVWKRIFRLFPLHLSILFVVLVWMRADAVPIPWWRYILGNALLIHRWNVWPASITSLNPPDWSISTEWAANLALPVFLWARFAGSRTARQCTFLFVSLLVFAFWRHGWNMDIYEARSWLPLIRCVGDFGLGVLLTRLPIVKHLLMDGHFARAISSRPFHWLGEISYGLYLTQIPVIVAVKQIGAATNTGTSPVWPLVAVVLIIGISWSAYRWIERPAIAYGARSWKSYQAFWFAQSSASS